MKPILFEIGPFVVYSYGAVLALGFLLATGLAMRCAKSEGINAGKILDLALVILIAGIVGSRALYVALNWSDFSNAPLSVFLLNKGGLAIYGGLGLGIPMGIWFVKKSGLAFWNVSDLISPYAALAQSIGRIGCFLNGCCFGKSTDLFLGIYFPNIPYRVYPTQIYSSFFLLVIFLILKYYYKKRRFHGQILLYYLILYSIFRFSIEMLRANPVFMFGLTFHQYISILLFAVSVIFYIRRKRLCRTFLSQ